MSGRRTDGRSCGTIWPRSKSAISPLGTAGAAITATAKEEEGAKQSSSGGSSRVVPRSNAAKKVERGAAAAVGGGRRFLRLGSSIWLKKPQPF